MGESKKANKLSLVVIAAALASFLVSAKAAPAKRIEIYSTNPAYWQYAGTPISMDD